MAQLSVDEASSATPGTSTSQTESGGLTTSGGTHDATTAMDVSVVRVDAEYASLVQVLLELCDDYGRCHASQVAIALRARDSDFFTRSSGRAFKTLVIQAEQNGAPVSWPDSYWGGPICIQLTLSKEFRDGFKKVRSSLGTLPLLSPS